MSLLTLSAAVFGGSALAQPTITALGDLAGTGEYFPVDLTDTGISVGTSVGTAPRVATRRPAAGPLVPFTVLTAGQDSDAWAISSDGQFSVGRARLNGLDRAVRWDVNGAIQNLGVIGSATESVAFGVSANGAVVVGRISKPSPNAFARAFRWTNNVMTDLGVLSTPAGCSDTYAVDVSDDGNTITGYAQYATGKIFRWTAAGGYQFIGSLQGADLSSGSQGLAQAISGDGSTIVGESRDFDNSYRAFIWKSSFGVLRVGSLGSASSAWCVDRVGNVVGGKYVIPGNFNRAFIASQATGGMVDLRDYLQGLGANVTNWVFFNVDAISPDGLTLAGPGSLNGVFTSFIVRLGQTRCSRADVGTVGGATSPDGRITVDDLIVYLQAFFAMNTSIADIATVGGATNPDGQVTADDLISCLQAFFLGCPT
jgi:probable HAF family extracellular repeat protein